MQFSSLVFLQSVWLEVLPEPVVVLVVLVVEVLLLLLLLLLLSLPVVVPSVMGGGVLVLSITRTL
jgi:hypothetical protein